ncbi:Cytidine deaminase, partial [Lachnellula suecica]
PSPTMSTTLLQSSDSSHVSSACDTHSITPTQFATLHTRCAAAKATAYCPYSRFRVGATILTDDGAFIDGANVENASYPVGTCAERVAFGKAVTEGHRKFRAVAVATDISPPASPCGMCRQFIREFCELDTPIFMFDKDGAFVVMKLEQLLPLSFGPEALPPPDSLPAQDKPLQL